MLSYMVHRLHSNWTSKLYRKPRIITIKMTSKYNVRWAFNASEWNPTKEEIIAATTYIQNEEKQRIAKFVFLDDAKSSLVGRLMLRKYVHMTTEIPYENIRLGRDAHGKPHLVGAGDLPISFSVSHQGDHVVLAGNMGNNIGIDIMKIEPPVNKDIPEFFRLMNRQFSQQEWSSVKSFPTESEQIACFYRIWCLKESYVKNIGCGLTIPLHEISFSLKTFQLRVGELVTDTKLYVRGELKNDWLIEETLIDDSHAVAVSIQCKGPREPSPVKYDFMTFEELVQEAKALSSPDEGFSEDFIRKQMKNF